MAIDMPYRHVSIKDIFFMRLLKYSCQSLFADKAIPRVHKIEIFALCSHDALVHCIVDALVRFRAPIGKVVLMLLDELAAAIGGAAVNDEPFVVGEGLANYAVVCSFQPLQVVEVDGDDG